MDVARLMGPGLRTPDDAWLFIADLFAAFGRPVAPADGCTAEELAAAALPLPAAVAAFYRRFGRRPELTDGQDPIVAPARLEVDDGFVVIRDENQYTAEWAVADLHQDDPPVLYRHEGEPWQPYLDRFSLAAADFALCETVFADDDLYNGAEVEPALVEQLQGTYATVPFPEYRTYPSPGTGPTLWLSAPGKLLRVDQFESPWIFVRGRTKQDLTELLTGIAANWTLGTGLD
ncbi:hypothetical protein [Dactylosporangium sp. NPDC051541]|uniref:hypothetical protein n=1 Tax=Dactylosporangium sp. NPDC051541 TaxID=3363977 RepID=UPI00378AA2BF